MADAHTLQEDHGPPLGRVASERKPVAFISKPFKFTKVFPRQKCSGKLRKAYSDPEREQELGECKILTDPLN